MVARILSMATSSSNSNFSARKLAHFRSNDRKAAQVSASRGQSTAADKANSHKQSAQDSVLILSTILICFLSIETRATESIRKIIDKVGYFSEAPLANNLELGLSIESEFSLATEEQHGFPQVSEIVQDTD